MNRTLLNGFVDMLTTIAFVLLASSGLMMAFVLPPGRRGGGGAVWGMTRHEWGDIHFWLSMGMIGLIVVHLFLHWRWVWSMIKGKPSSARPLRRYALGALLAVVLAVAAAPFFAAVDKSVADEHGQAEQQRGGRGEGRGGMRRGQLQGESH